MVQTTYAAPVNALLSFGEAHAHQLRQWPDYLKQFNLTAADIPELIRMATDSELNWAESESLEVWAPVHAWRALGQLNAEAAIEPLISIFNEMDDNDWFREEMPYVFGLIGPSAIPAIAEYLATPNKLFSIRWVSIEILEKIGEQHPSARDECIRVLVQQLEQSAKNSRELNGALICGFIELKATEAAPLMKTVFAANRVDTSIPGDWIDVQQALGLISSFEAYDLRQHVDAEHLRAKATKLRESTVGFGQGTKASTKSKSKRK